VSASPLTRARTGADPGWREIVIQRSSHRQKRCDGRGTGAVKATGSYEGSLPTEGILDHHEASTFTRRRRRWSWRSPHPPTRTITREGRTARLQHPGSRVRREGERGARDRDVRGSIASMPWEENTHARALGRKAAGREVSC